MRTLVRLRGSLKAVPCDLPSSGDDVRAGLDAEERDGTLGVIGLRLGLRRPGHWLGPGQRPEDAAETVRIGAILPDHGVGLLVGDVVRKAVHAGLAAEKIPQRNSGEFFLLKGVGHADGGGIDEVQGLTKFLQRPQIDPPTAIQGGSRMQRTKGTCGIVSGDEEGVLRRVVNLEVIETAILNVTERMRAVGIRADADLADLIATRRQPCGERLIETGIGSVRSWPDAVLRVEIMHLIQNDIRHERLRADGSAVVNAASLELMRILMENASLAQGGSGLLPHA